MGVIKNVIGFAFLMSSVFIFGLLGKPTEMGIAVAAGFVYLAFANLEKFAEFKGAGFEAKLRNVVTEATLTLQNLKDVAGPLIDTNLRTIAEANRIVGSSFERSHDMFDKMLDLQEKLSLSSREVEAAKALYLTVFAWDMTHELAREIEGSCEKGFLERYTKGLGQKNREKAPDKAVLFKMLSEVELTDSCKKKVDILRAYYTKYRL